MGLDSSIYPWGVKLLNECVSGKENSNVDIIGLNNSKGLHNIFRKYQSVLSDLYFALPTEARSIFIGHTINPFLFIGPVAMAGESFIDQCVKSKLLSKRFLNNISLRESVKALKNEFDQTIGEAFHGYLGEYELPNVWMISVYDYTLFNSLYHALIIRYIDPSGIIIMGGDYFDEEYARQTIEHADFIDGIVVGYGEIPVSNLIDQLQNGISFHQIKIQGLISRANNQAITENFNDLLNPAYSRNNEPSLQYVVKYGKQSIRLLTQRGCSWGECTFCTQLDRRNWQPVNQEKINEQFSSVLESLLKTNPETSKIKVFFDSDENDLKAILPIIDICKKNEYKDICFTLEFWLMVRKFRVDLPIALLESNSSLEVRVMLNIESLNPATLKRMKKGTNPLLALQSVKAMLDSGQVVMTNYFTSFPGESVDDIREEVDYLRSSLHLFQGPQTQISGFPYAANARDDLGNHASPISKKTVRNESDRWVELFFHFDMPFTIWAYVPNPSSEKENFLTSLYRKKNALYQSFLRSKAAVHLFGHPKSSRYFTYTRLKFKSLELINKLISGIKRDNPFLKRELVFKDIENIQKNEKDSCRFFVEGNILIKNYRIGETKLDFRFTLSEADLRVLRACYWLTTPEKVSSELGVHFSTDTIAESLKRLIERKAIVQYRNFILSIINDPEFWNVR